jgi:hypothetical protein
MKKILFTISIFIGVLFFGCSTDFDINANWKDITIVYGLLNQKDSIHYIKINKAFLGEGDILTMAQNPDSSSYGNNLEVRIDEYDGNSFQKSFYLDTTTVYNKEPGVFYYPKQILYKFVGTLNENFEYRLFIKNKLTGKEITSKTILVKNFSISSPNTGIAFNPAYNNFSPIKVKWYPAINGKRYQVFLRFTYSERPLAATDSVFNSIDYNIGTIQSSSISSDDIILEYYGQSFYDFLYSKLTKDQTLYRWASKAEVFIYVAGSELNTYMEVTEPSSSIVQEKPSYTNINGGIGIYSCRYYKSVIYKSVQLKNIPMMQELSFKNLYPI